MGAYLKKKQCQKVNDLAYARFKEAPSKRQPVTTRNLLEFGLASAAPLIGPNYKFTASLG